MRLVAVTGNTGAGKTTLTRFLADSLGWTALIEDPTTNPYFQDFVASPASWALHVQLFYLARHLRDIAYMNRTQANFVRDRSFSEGFAVYGLGLFEEGLLTRRDWDLYVSIYEHLAPRFPVPDLMIYVRADDHRLINRIRERARPGEAEAIRPRLAKFNSLYDTWIRQFTACPVLTVNASDIDTTVNAKALENFANSVRLRLDVESE